MCSGRTTNAAMGCAKKIRGRDDVVRGIFGVLLGSNSGLLCVHGRRIRSLRCSVKVS